MATKINNVPLSQLTLASHAQCHQEVTALIESLTAEKLHLETLAPQYAAAVTAEQQVVNRPTAYAETADMQQADHVRDLTLSLLFNLVDAYAGSPKDAQQKSAHTLVSLLLPYRGIQTHEMHRQTTETSGLITALGETSADAALTALGLDDLPEALDTANANFLKAEAQRDKEALRRQPVSQADSKQLRLQADALYRQVVDTVNAYTLIQPSAEITDFVARMNVIVAKYRNVVANQAKTKKRSSPSEKKE
ncbi:MAG: DUF6261 family protein [Bacteroides intestinalis]